MGDDAMTIEHTISLNLSRLKARVVKGDQGCNILITPKLGEQIMDLTEATIISSVLNDIFSKEA